MSSWLWQPLRDTATSGAFASIELYFPNYASTTADKSFNAESAQEVNAAASYTNLVAGLWTNTAAINQLTITNGTGYSFVQNSTATLYGIKSS